MSQTAKEMKIALNVPSHLSTVQTFLPKLKEVSWVKLILHRHSQCCT